MGDRQKKTVLFEQLARVGKALGSGKRLELLDLLAQGERSVEHLAAAAQLGLSTTSAHLQVLKQAGLVTTRRDGTRVHYGLAGLDVIRLYEQLRNVAGERVSDVGRAREDYLVSGRAAGAPGERDEVGRDELLARVAAGEVTVLDVRPVEEYVAAHIPGAVSIPVEELPRRINELPSGQDVVAYCRGAYCVLAYEAVDLLRAAGRTAWRLHEGMLEWRLTELPVDTGPGLVASGVAARLHDQ
ncbi:metalloregulator ArsR/SmtB family transcription factor [Nesterenkonia sp. AY15]|uniref:ArsR/SmtB family transcription factor n=1 Tax=Nesterenkonia sp. AY15 TaxID=2901139 RepID=UPI001F4CC147|nr:metalloregulator ArsR/SmtB family transcription factor [Nesterenkonia sp. AY15]MCH8570222.1 metalloregulator ArsR/SmtB family transcription factor [Nesterenkonia sp. AY15]